MLHIGLIGCGYIAKKHLKTLVQVDGMALVAVSDIQEIRMDEAATFYQEKKGKQTPISFYVNYHDMLTDPKIDAVIIATISGLHAEIAKSALIHSKHIIIEKPLALSLKDADDIIALSKKYNKTVLVCHQLRYRPVIQRIRELIEAGHFGKPYLGIASIRLNRSQEYYDSATWKGSWGQDGGMLVNQGIHLVDLLIWLIGDVKSVYGEIGRKIDNKEIEDIATGIISFKNNAKGIIEANTITKPKNIGYYLSIFGEKGTICLGGKNFNKIEHCYLDGYPDLEEELQSLSNRFDEHYLMYQDFLKAVLNDQPILMNANEGKRALEAIFAVYQSNQLNIPVSLPMETFATKDMLD